MRNSSSAQLEMLVDAQDDSALSPLQQAVAERLAQHRAKGAARHSQQETPQPEQQVLSDRAARARAAVAERYAKVPTYHDMLAAEAERARLEAEAAAEVAARNAQAVAQAQQQLLAELEQWPVPAPEPAEAEQFLPLEEAAPLEIYAGPRELRVQHHEDLAPRMPLPSQAAHPQQPAFVDEAEQQALDEEIAFRQSPDFGVHEPIPANLLEFPRQLVASIKARPRLAEGPLRDEAEAAEPQLRIFEVEASQVSTTPSIELPQQTEWVPLVLETAKPEPRHAVAAQPLFLPQVAPLGLRLMAGIFDACLVFAAALAFLTVAALEMQPLPQKYLTYGFPAAFLVMHVLYQLLFFTWSETTPGMRYARIGLCTFNDDNPTRSAMRRRILATVLSAAPLGLGFLWACLDEDGLGWHDRISRIYQRSY